MTLHKICYINAGIPRVKWHLPFEQFTYIFHFYLYFYINAYGFLKTKSVIGKLFNINPTIFNKQI